MDVTMLFLCSMFVVQAWSHHTHTSPSAEELWCPVEGQRLVGGESRASMLPSQTPAAMRFSEFFWGNQKQFV